MNFGYPWVDHYANTSLFPTHLLLGFFTKHTVAIAQLEILGWILLGGFGIYFCVLEYGFSRRAALVSAISLIFSGQLIALPQWSNQVYNATCFIFMLLGYQRAKKTGSPFNLLSVIFLTLSVLGGYVAATVLSIHLFTAYVLIDSLTEKRFLLKLNSWPRRWSRHSCCRSPNYFLFISRSQVARVRLLQ